MPSFCVSAMSQVASSAASSAALAKSALLSHCLIVNIGRRGFPARLRYTYLLPGGKTMQRLTRVPLGIRILAGVLVGIAVGLLLPKPGTAAWADTLAISGQVAGQV